MSRVQALTGRAVDTLEDLLGAEKYPNVRLGAARTIAEIGIHQHDAEHILHKLDEIEPPSGRGVGRDAWFAERGPSPRGAARPSGWCGTAARRVGGTKRSPGFTGRIRCRIPPAA